MWRQSHSWVPAKKPQSNHHSRKLWLNISSSLVRCLPNSGWMNHFQIGVYRSVRRVFTNHFVQNLSLYRERELLASFQWDCRSSSDEFYRHFLWTLEHSWPDWWGLAADEFGLLQGMDDIGAFDFKLASRYGKRVLRIASNNIEEVLSNLRWSVKSLCFSKLPGVKTYPLNFRMFLMGQTSRFSSGTFAFLSFDNQASRSRSAKVAELRIWSICDRKETYYSLLLASFLLRLEHLQSRWLIQLESASHELHFRYYFLYSSSFVSFESFVSSKHGSKLSLIRRVSKWLSPALKSKSFL